MPHERLYNTHESISNENLLSSHSVFVAAEVNDGECIIVTAKRWVPPHAILDVWRLFLYTFVVVVVVLVAVVALGVAVVAVAVVVVVCVVVVIVAVVLEFVVVVVVVIVVVLAVAVDAIVVEIENCNGMPFSFKSSRQNQPIITQS